MWKRLHATLIILAKYFRSSKEVKRRYHHVRGMVDNEDITIDGVTSTSLNIIRHIETLYHTVN